jgi:hypothetical protein
MSGDQIVKDKDLTPNLHAANGPTRCRAKENRLPVEGEAGLLWA